ncbi:hypothetical protein HYH03_003965 [Edaphochlamys debaryana]|uniref:VWFA domain-containing protein n=1 Tax=Edaphochlamys debaryana TaxID=47281 RepID=A0A835YID7_9CHLO|nr:hypothetical protein HYH03_003965 [Edaphochlamys debaryana]|eukprot:KAG2498214.1 hypothetical protein HYH03_003965 [Edaphochlamys debaryana]
MLVGAMGQMGYVPMPLTRLTVEAKAQISVGFVKTTLECYYPQTWPQTYLQLCFPKSVNTVISEVVIENLMRDQIYCTAIVPADEAQKGNYRPSQAYDPSGQLMGSDPSANDPELFLLPLPPGRAQPGDCFRVSLTTFEPLAFEEGSYVLRLPTELPANVIPQGYSHSTMVDVIVTINSGSPQPVKYDVRSGHAVTLGVEQPGTVTMSANKDAQMPNADVEVGYRVWGNDMFLALNVTPPRPPHPADPDPRGSFVLTVAPPAPEFTHPFPRSIIFVLDRSGSMSGEPMQFAKAALMFGLRSLTPSDTFTIAAFDHEQLWFTPGGQLLAATPDNVMAAEAWIRSSVDARGLTDIMGPLQTAMRVLSSLPQSQAGKPPSLPFIFLVTDGCVQDEKDICRVVEQQVRGLMEQQRLATLGQAPPGTPPPTGIPRICTFGIGPYCNHYFLKQLASYGRGAFDVAFRPHAIQAQMQKMLTAAQRPVLSDLTITLPGVEGAELYPYPLPDLFCGMPLVISGKYSGQWPSTGITLNGMLPGGAAWSSNPVLPAKDCDLPLDKVFIKSRLDLLTAQAWLAGNPPQMVNQIVDLSIATGVPCAHTRTVGFETKKADYEAMQAQQAKDGKRKTNYAKYAIGGAAGLVVLAGLGVGAAFVFGDLGASMANAGALGGGGGMMDAGGGCCDCGDGGCGDCGDCGDGCDGCDGCDGLDVGGCTIS